MKISRITPNLYIQKPISKKNDIRKSYNIKNDILSFGIKKNQAYEQSVVLGKTIIPNLFKIKSRIKEEREEKIFQQFLEREGKISKKEYYYIKNKYPFILDKAVDMVIENNYSYTTPSEMAKFAVNAKNYLDNCDKLKEKNYCIISIGTSPAPLTETLKNLGCNVIFLPISGIRFTNETDKENVKKNNNLKLSLEYAKEKSKELNLTKDTEYIVLDYAFSRKTLNTVSQSIYENNYIATKEKVWDISLAQLMNAIYKSNEVPLKIKSTPESIEQFLSEFDDDLYCSDFTPLCNVPHFYLDDEKNKSRLGSVSSSKKSKKELFEEFDKYSKPLARCYSLCTLEILDSMGEIKCK